MKEWPTMSDEEFMADPEVSDVEYAKGHPFDFIEKLS
jgi:hypothetical protein